MIKFYYSLAPNPMKVALFLEEAGLAYEAIPVDTRKGEQFDPAFAAVNPNNKVPAIVDGDVTVFDSNAILLYLGEKTGKFMPGSSPQARADMFSWMMFVGTGMGPYSGQAVHFRHHSPPGNDYGATRYLFEAKRHYGILNDRLAKQEWMLGSEYSVVDMAVWGWGRMAPYVMGSSPKDMSVWEEFPHVKRMLDVINARPAAIRAEALRERHAFKTELDAEAKRHMFRFLAEPVI